MDERGRTALYNLINDMFRENKTVIISTQDENIIKQANILIDLDEKPSPRVMIQKKGKV